MKTLRALGKILLVLLLVAAVAGLIAYLVRGDSILPGKSASLELSVLGENFVTGTELPSADSLRVDVTNVDTYSVSIIPGDVSFDFRLNGALHKFPYVDGDLSSAFGLTLHEDYFTLTTSTRSMTMLLQSLYPEQTVSDVGHIDRNAVCFIVRVTSGSTVIELPIKGFIPFMEVTLDQTEIIF